MYSLMTWVVGQGCTFKFAGSTKLGRLVGAAEGSVAIQKDLDRLEKRTDRTLRKLSTLLLCPV